MKDSVGLWYRACAILIDALIINLPLIVIINSITGHWDEDGIPSFIYFLYTLILPIVWNGYTVGKRIVGIRIVRVDGGKLGFGTMLLRTLVADILYAVTFGIGGIVSVFMVGLRNDHRSIHDLIAGTYVTTNKP